MALLNKSIEMNTKNLALIGFAKNVPFKNKWLALCTGFITSCFGYNLYAGNVIGTFYFGFIGHKVALGAGIAILERVDFKFNNFNMKQIVVYDKHAKHLTIAKTCQGAIVIGGGKHSLHLIECMLANNKPVVAIEHTYGIVENELPQGCEIKSNVYSAMSWLHNKINETH